MVVSVRNVEIILCDVWAAGGEYQSRLANGIAAALSRLKDVDMEGKEGLRQELQQSADMLDQAARLAMAALLQVRHGDGAALSDSSNTGVF
jgi:hypothetical protein